MEVTEINRILQNMSKSGTNQILNLIKDYSTEEISRQTARKANIIIEYYKEFIYVYNITKLTVLCYQKHSGFNWEASKRSNLEDMYRAALGSSVNDYPESTYYKGTNEMWDKFLTLVNKQKLKENIL